MEPETAGKQTTRTTPRSPKVPAARRGNAAALASIGNAPSADGGGSGTGGPQQAATVQPNGPSKTEDGSAAEGLSPPFETGSQLPPLVLPAESKSLSRLAMSQLALALFSIALLSFVVVAAFVTLWLGRKIDDLTRLLEIIFAPIIALVAAAVAFYYRGKAL